MFQHPWDTKPGIFRLFWGLCGPGSAHRTRPGHHRELELFLSTGGLRLKQEKKSHLSVNIPNSCCSHFLKTELLFAGASLSLSRGCFVLDFQAKLWE